MSRINFPTGEKSEPDICLHLMNISFQIIGNLNQNFKDCFSFFGNYTARSLERHEVPRGPR
ncbi:hypothetical protein RchiOBHm_Chr1g0376491 [Rosa chinensis]|uniref:Uncharacterized protein n=1 Tax=Rosa chinensis TaxID=74649 RepID=A0A2P6SMX5_ROSCH|nr:hypothetical protein RchiOBHm_Chr1g0376491 [Rosa chinensis]